ncbi:GyrI-like domain-containing protein [Microbacterium esteraromaticum]|uniref:GyrI-like domain-containing protein n=1 Tax=Microbacterium esteraromaticum TaxID=57043 RepID=UPI002367E8FF|nr:GyrI-like domain-containing protein [Microbacterium esteraromaticum]WDH78030.1 GyrI-like domain-containing protein [Microbacterium esteraromaticum]
MTKSDFKKTLDRYRSAPGEFRVLEVPATRYLMIDGAGDPNSSPEYTAALEALYPLAYAVKFASARELGQDYVVPPLEGLWWADDMTAFTSARDKSRWHWTLMLMVPDWIPVAFVEAARERVAAKKAPPARLGRVRSETLTEGLCVQTLHVGAFDDEGPLLARMHDEFIPGAGLRMTGRHHEIYLSDPRRTAPERLRTLLRQPVRAVSDTA